jgi:hypothetical protein
MAFLLIYFRRIRGILFSAKMPRAIDAKDINVVYLPWLLGGRQNRKY